MAYHINAENVSLGDLRRRIEETDLVPSRATLLDGLTVKFEALEQQGITTFAGLLHALKTPKRLEVLSNTTGIDPQYLILLRREIESYFPTPCALAAFNCFPVEEISKLEERGIRDTAALYTQAVSVSSLAEFAESIGVAPANLEALFSLADLTRVQWVSPTTARMLVEAGYTSVYRLAVADANELCKAIVRVNAGNRFFKGKIGLRDIKRLIRAAGYVL